MDKDALELVRRLADWLRGVSPALPPEASELRPFDLAEASEALEQDEVLRLLGALEPEIAAETLEHLDFTAQYRLLDKLPPEASGAILAAMSSDGLADLVKAVHPRQAEALLVRLEAGEAATIRRLITYPEDTAGAIMTADYISVRCNQTAAGVLEHIRKVAGDAEVYAYIYVVDNRGRLAGAMSLRELILAEPASQVETFMTHDLVSVNGYADQEEAARLLADYDFVAIPVVDDAGRLVGVISVDDVLDVVQDEATEDIQRLGGSAPLDEPYLESSFARLFRKRIGWLLLLFVVQSITSNILGFFQSFLEQVVALTFFIPLLIGTGGNAGGQAATLVIRAMALGEIGCGDVLRVVWREARLALTLGVTMAAATLGWALLLSQPAALGLTVALSVAAVVLVGSTVGALMPLVGRRLGFDPAVFSAPLITTVADTVGLLVYFQIARVVLGLAR